MAKLLNSIAIGNVARATAFTTPKIEAYIADRPSKVATFEPNNHELCSASGRSDLHDWFVNQWSVSAVIMDSEPAEDGQNEFFPHRFEIPFEIINRVELLKDMAEGEWSTDMPRSC